MKRIGNIFFYALHYFVIPRNNHCFFYRYTPTSTITPDLNFTVNLSS